MASLYSQRTKQPCLTPRRKTPCFAVTKSTSRKKTHPERHAFILSRSSESGTISTFAGVTCRDAMERSRRSDPSRINRWSRNEEVLVRSDMALGVLMKPARLARSWLLFVMIQKQQDRTS